MKTGSQNKPVKRGQVWPPRKQAIHLNPGNVIVVCLDEDGRLVTKRYATTQEAMQVFHGDLEDFEIIRAKRGPVALQRTTAKFWREAAQKELERRVVSGTGR